MEDKTPYNPHERHTIGRISPARKRIDECIDEGIKRILEESQDLRSKYSFLPEDVLSTMIDASERLKVRRNGDESEDHLIAMMYKCPLIFQKILKDFIEITKRDIEAIRPLNKELDINVYEKRILPAYELFSRIAQIKIEPERFVYDVKQTEFEEAINDAFKVLEEFKQLAESKISRNYNF
ncbi:hypothetical protein KY308_01370 [Candidatus Woesearchaeota archaeon]|nr:hypothetical protein [Candidatus Woesearchaeota archaeon]